MQASDIGVVPFLPHVYRVLWDIQNSHPTLFLPHFPGPPYPHISLFGFLLSAPHIFLHLHITRITRSLFHYFTNHLLHAPTLELAITAYPTPYYYHPLFIPGSLSSHRRSVAFMPRGPSTRNCSPISGSSPWSHSHLPPSRTLFNTLVASSSQLYPTIPVTIVYMYVYQITSRKKCPYGAVSNAMGSETTDP